MQIHESGEMYLETILVLSEKSAFVRAIDIGEALGYSKPSVSRAMRILREENYLRVGNDGGITLTEKGALLANKIYERHQVLSRLLQSYGIDEETATEDACRIEHVISDESFNAIKAYIKKEQA